MLNFCPNLAVQTRQMNILHVTPFYSCERGGERHVKEVSEHLAAGGHRVTVLTTNVESERDLLRGEKGVLPKSEIINGVHVMRISATSKILSNVLSGCERVKGGYRSLSLLFTSGGLEMLHARPGNLGFLYSILRSDADIVASWNWYFPPAYYAHLARRLRGFRLVGIPFFHTAERWSQNPVYDDIVTTCDGFIVNTEHERRFILKRMPTATRIAVVGPGTNPALFNMRDSLNFRKRYGLGDAPLIGFVGSLGIQKGADTLLEAMPLVWRWNGNVRLVLAGYESSNFSKIEQLIHGLSRDYQSRILILSNFPESEKPNLYEAIDIFALPSTSESFGIAYLEAWICTVFSEGAPSGVASQPSIG